MIASKVSRDSEVASKLTKEDMNMLSVINSRLVKAGLQICLLKMLSKGPNHGYEIMKGVKKLTKNISTSLIYNCLGELENAGYIIGTWEHNDASPSKKNYEITESGKHMLKASKKILSCMMHELLANDTD
jgi:DNA-binding PadR family transcriptional regulator